LTELYQEYESLLNIYQLTTTITDSTTPLGFSLSPLFFSLLSLSPHPSFPLLPYIVNTTSRTPSPPLPSTTPNPKPATATLAETRRAQGQHERVVRKRNRTFLISECLLSTISPPLPTLKLKKVWCQFYPFIYFFGLYSVLLLDHSNNNNNNNL
jgi:hypothetical protein